jgi:hypothetical protein
MRARHLDGAFASRHLSGEIILGTCFAGAKQVLGVKRLQQARRV